jgi:hypothetical protein
MAGGSVCGAMFGTGACPLPLSPQHTRAPSSRIAQLWAKPAVIAT